MGKQRDVELEEEHFGITFFKDLIWVQNSVGYNRANNLFLYPMFNLASLMFQIVLFLS